MLGVVGTLLGGYVFGSRGYHVEKPFLDFDVIIHGFLN